MCVGVDFKIKIIEGNGSRIKLTIWDTAGQERFRSLTSSYYRGAQGVILVYDVTSRESFDSLKETWLKELQVYADLDDLILMVVGNKVDLEGRQVSIEEGRQFSKDISALFMESSAKTKIGIKAIFEELVRKILNSSILQNQHKQHSQSETKGNIVSLQNDDEDTEEQSACSC